MKRITLNKNFTIFSLLLLISLFLASIILILYSLLNNSLKKNDSWRSSKLDLGMYVMGRSEFFDSHQALANNRLNLSAWFGYNEVLTIKSFPLKTVDFDFYLDNNSFFYFIFDKGTDQFSAVRLGNSSDFPSANLIIGQTGKIYSNTPIKTQNISPKNWHHAQFNFDSNNKTMGMEIDNIKILNLESNYQNNQKFGFRSSNNKVLIDNVKAKDINGKQIFLEDFSYHDGLFFLKFIFLLMVICLTGIVIWFISVRFGKYDIKKALYLVIFYLAILLIALLVITWYAWAIFTPSYPSDKSILNNIIHKLNIKSLKVWANDPLVHFEENKKNFEKYTLDNNKKIIFIGTSQTWGAGAKTEDETFVRVFGSEVTKYASKSADKNSYQVINAAIPGSYSTELLHYYKENWIKLLPKIVIINLSSNDIDSEIFKNNLYEFIKLNKEYQIKTVFILEPNSFEYFPGDMANRRVMKEVGQSEGIRVLDLHEYIKSKKDTGILWWDFVHPTSYGHRLAGDFIFEGVKDMIN